MRNDFRRGFVMIYVLGLTLAFGAVFYGIVSIISMMDEASDYVASSVDYWTAGRNEKNASLEFDEAMNSNGSSEDTLSCSWGLVTCTSSGATCSSNDWIPAPDGIADACDDDDYRATFYTGEVLALLSPDSEKFDDDDLPRLHRIGFVPPRSSVTAFVMNSDIAQTISLDPNNVFGIRKSPLQEPFSIRLKSSPAWASLTLFKLDKTKYDSEYATSVISRLEGAATIEEGVYSANGSVETSGAPYFFDASKYDYVLRIGNDTDVPVSFDVSGHSSGVPVYLNPVYGPKGFRKLVPTPYYGSGLE